MKKEPWRWIVGSISIAWIVFMWVKKDILSIYAAVPKEQFLPMAATTVAVSLVKVLLLAGTILLIKWIAGKRKK